MTDPAAYGGWVKSAAEELGGCDIFISFASAGGGPASEETWKKVFDLDLMATYRGIQAALPFLEKSKSRLHYRGVPPPRRWRTSSDPRPTTRSRRR